MSRVSRLAQMLAQPPYLLQTAPSDGPVPDTAEQVYISSLALLKVSRLFTIKRRTK